MGFANFKSKHQAFASTMSSVKIQAQPTNRTSTNENARNKIIYIKWRYNVTEQQQKINRTKYINHSKYNLKKKKKS